MGRVLHNNNYICFDAMQYLIKIWKKEKYSQFPLKYITFQSREYNSRYQISLESFHS